MESLVEFTPAPPSSWPEAAAQENFDRKRSDTLVGRYEALLRLSRYLMSARRMEVADVAESKALAWMSSTSHHWPFVQVRQSFLSRVEVISPFLHQLMHFINKFRNADGSEIDIEIALCEALTNAVVHGNHEDPDGRVYVVCRCHTDGEVSITIRDQGRGFDSLAVPDPTGPEKLLSTHGRGIYLMRALMDEVCFEEGGSVVHMRKRPSNSGTANLQHLRPGRSLPINRFTKFKIQ